MLGPQADKVVTNMMLNKLRKLKPYVHNMQLLKGVRDVLSIMRAPNTVKTYRSGLASYVNWYMSQGIPMCDAWPASIDTLACWGVDFCSRDTYQAFKKYVNGLKYFHMKTRSPIEAFEDEWWKSFQMGLRKYARRKVKANRWPITFPQLLRIIQQLDETNPNQALRGLVYCVGFFGGPRPSEYLKKYIGSDLTQDNEGLVHPIIRWRDVTVTGASPNRIVSIKVHGSKFDPEDQGYRMDFTENGTEASVLKWLEVHREHRKRNNSHGEYMPLFSEKELPLTVETAKKWLKQDAKRAGYLAHNYTAYSLRRGLATTLFLLGARPTTIKRWGRWRSDSYRDYIELDPTTTGLWTTKMVNAKWKEFGNLTLEAASVLTLSTVDEFYKAYRSTLRR